MISWMFDNKSVSGLLGWWSEIFEDLPIFPWLTPVRVSSAASTAVKTATTSTSTNSVLTDALAHETNGVLTYSGALAVLQDAAKSAMSATEFADLDGGREGPQRLGRDQTSAYVQQMFDNVVLGNSANAHWNGGANTAAALGNLSATSTQAQFNELIDKWFLGTDMPGVEPAPGSRWRADRLQGLHAAAVHQRRTQDYRREPGPGRRLLVPRGARRNRLAGSVADREYDHVQRQWNLLRASSRSMATPTT